MKTASPESMPRIKTASEEQSGPLLTVMIVTYNTRELTLTCLRTLFPLLTGIESEVWVVDNASADETIEAIEVEFPSVLLIRNETNLGFGAANNQAMQRATGKYFLLLNTDAFPKPGAIEQLIETLEANPQVAAVGPRLFYGDGSPQKSIHTFPSPGHAWALYSGLLALRTRLSPPRDFAAGIIHDHFLSGACLMVRKSAYDRVGGFDESFFFYMDEIDWLKRMIGEGLELAYVPTAEVVHLEGKSGSKDRIRFTLWYYVGTDTYIYKHYRLTGLILYRLAVTLWCLRKLAVFVPRGLLQRKEGKKESTFAIRVHSFLLLHILKSPREIGRSIPIA